MSVAEPQLLTRQQLVPELQRLLAAGQVAMTCWWWPPTFGGWSWSGGFGAIFMVRLRQGRSVGCSIHNRPMAQPWRQRCWAPMKRKFSLT